MKSIYLYHIAISHNYHLIWQVCFTWAIPSLVESTSSCVLLKGQTKDLAENGKRKFHNVFRVPFSKRTLPTQKEI